MSWRVPFRARTPAARAFVMFAALLTTALVLALAHGAQLPIGARTPAAHGAAALSAMPLSARGPMSAAVGADESSYRVHALGDGALESLNPAQRLRARFTPAGVALSAGGLRGRIAFSALGYGGALAPVERVAPAARANRVSYAHAGAREWYANGPLGLEQGFTIAQPRGAHAGALTLALEVAGGVQLRRARDGRSVTFLHRGAAVLSYGGLAATDARGRTLRSRIALRAHQILLTVDTAGARYPLHIDPFIQEGGKLTVGGEEADSGKLGMSVALSADGRTALLGAPYDGNFAGAVWVFVRTAGGWVQQGPKLTSGEPGGEGSEQCGEGGEGEEEECAFGRSVALSADGNTAIVGGPRAAGPCPSGAGECAHMGAAWIYARTGGAWSLQAELRGGAEETREGRLGRSVAISADGSTALVGASNDKWGAGAAFAFARAGSSWTQQGPKLTGSAEGGTAHFGGSVALSADGRTALIGGPCDSSSVGAAWVFTRSGLSWSAPGLKLTGGEEQGAGHFGFSVALSADGSTALVGGRMDEAAAGAAWVFTRTGLLWSQQGAKLTGAGAQAPSAFGYSVALSADGNRALIGGPRDGGATGAAWLFARTAGSWSQEGEKLNGLESPEEPPPRGDFGYSVALRADGRAALIGAPLDSGKRGAAWVFGELGSLPQVSALRPDFGPAAGGTAVTISGSQLAGVTAVNFESGQESIAASFSVERSGSITAIAPPQPAGSGAGGKVFVTVTTAEGTSARSAASTFTYVPVPAGSGAPSGPGCSPALLSRNVRVLTHARVAVRLRARGSVRCRGRLTLRVWVRHGRHSRFKAIGRASFSLAPARAVTATVKLNALGRALLRRSRGRATANLLVTRLAPGAVQARSANVRLTVEARNRKRR